MLESIIKTARYKLHRKIGQGCWGAVYHATDDLLGGDVAIKVMAPSELAQQQMRERQLDVFGAMKKEAGKLTAVAHVVPRRFELDEDGRPFIFMPLYSSFLSDYIKDEDKKPFI